MSIVSRLPSFYRANSTFVKIAQLLEGSSCRFGGLFLTQENSTNLLLKDGTIHIQLDWEAYSLLRATSKLIIGSGEVIRSEPGIFNVRQTYNNPHIDQLYQKFVGEEKQKMCIFTRKYTRQQLSSNINEKLYEIVALPSLNSVHHAISLLNAQPQNQPISIEFGINLLDQYFDGVRQGGKNCIDTLMISRFKAKVDSKLVGPQLKLNFAEYYKEVWKSEAFKCPLTNGQQGELTFEVHKLK